MKFSHALIAMGTVYAANHVLSSKLFLIYQTYPNFDVPMHFIGGFTAGMVGLAIHTYAYNGKKRRSVPKWYSVLFVLGATAMIAVVWEYYEFTLDQLNRGRAGWYSMQPTVVDTMADIFLGMFGSASAIGIFRKHL